MDCVVDVSVGSGYPTDSCSLPFDQLWISVMASVCYEKKLLCLSVDIGVGI